MKYKVEYDLIYDEQGDYEYHEWNISNGARLYKCYSEEDANWLVDLLNKEKI